MGALPLDFAKEVSPPDQGAGVAPESMPFPNLSPGTGTCCKCSHPVGSGRRPGSEI